MVMATDYQKNLCINCSILELDEMDLRSFFSVWFAFLTFWFLIKLTLTLEHMATFAALSSRNNLEYSVDWYTSGCFPFSIWQLFFSKTKMAAKQNIVKAEGNHGTVFHMKYLQHMKL